MVLTVAPLPHTDSPPSGAPNHSSGNSSSYHTEKVGGNARTRTAPPARPARDKPPQAKPGQARPSLGTGRAQARGRQTGAGVARSPHRTCLLHYQRYVKSGLSLFCNSLGSFGAGVGACAITTTNVGACFTVVSTATRWRHRSNSRSAAQAVALWHSRARARLSMSCAARISP